jgi:rhodanese-related sulfurtransferase
VVTWVWLAEIGPAPHLWFSRHDKLASWVTLCPGGNVSARKRKSGRTGDAGTYIKPALIQAGFVNAKWLHCSLLIWPRLGRGAAGL